MSDKRVFRALMFAGFIGCVSFVISDTMFLAAADSDANIILRKEILTVRVNGMDFYCEKSGSGPTIVLVPDGGNDCGPYGKLAELLSDEYTVLTFDPRGGSRSPDPHPKQVTPSRLADDVAAIVRALKLDPVAAAYGCSSGGQTVLAFGKRHSKMAKVILVHEAALQSDTPLPEAGFIFFEKNNTFEQHMPDGLSAADVWSIGSMEGVEAMPPDARTRIQGTGGYWAKYYRGSVDRDQYMAEDFAKMPPVEFTVGAWTPSWLVFANIETAKRGQCPVTWLNCAHHPELTCPAELAAHIKKTVKKYLVESK